MAAAEVDYLNLDKSVVHNDIVDKDHYIDIAYPEPKPYVNGDSILISANGGTGFHDALINIKDYTFFNITFSAASNMTLYFTKSDGTGVQSYGASSFPAQPLNITNYDYVYIVGNAGDRTIKITCS